MNIYKNKVMVQTTSDLLEALVPAATEEVTIIDKLPPIRWKGKLIPISLWNQVCSFFQAVHDKHSSEATVRLFYDEVKGWNVGVYPQKATGGSAEEIKDHADIAKISEEETRGVQVGSIHSHSSMSAFQSGTDLKDEEKSDGIHFTVGGLKADKLEEVDVHVRVMLSGLEYPNPWLYGWFEAPAWGADLPPPVKEASIEWAQRHPETVSFPAQWLDRIEKPTYEYGCYNSRWNGYNYNGDDDYGTNWRQGEFGEVADTSAKSYLPAATAEQVGNAWGPQDDEMEGPGDDLDVDADTADQARIPATEYNGLAALLEKLSQVVFPKSILEDVTELIREIFDVNVELAREALAKSKEGAAKKAAKNGNK